MGSMVKSSKLSCSGKAFDMGVVSVRRMVSPSELVVVWSVYQVSSSYILLQFRFPLGNSDFCTSQLWFDQTLLIKVASPYVELDSSNMKKGTMVLLSQSSVLLIRQHSL